MPDIKRFVLDAPGSGSGPTDLLDFLIAAEEAAVEIDAAAASQVDTLRLQILLAALRDRAAGTLRVVNMGAELREGIRRLGIDPARFESEVKV